MIGCSLQNSFKISNNEQHYFYPIQGNLLKDRGKRFEGSLTRVLIIMIITYCTIFGYLIYLGIPKPGNLQDNFVILTISLNKLYCQY